MKPRKVQDTFLSWLIFSHVVLHRWKIPAFLSNHHVARGSRRRNLSATSVLEVYQLLFCFYHQ